YVVEFAGRSAIRGPVVLLGVPPVRENQVVDREGLGLGGARGAERSRLSAGLPLGDDTGVQLVALRGAVGAEVTVLAVDGYDCEVRGLVVTVGRGTAGSWHGWCVSEAGQNSTCTAWEEPLCRTILRKMGTLTSAFGRTYVQSGRRDSNPRRPAWEAE